MASSSVAPLVGPPVLRQGLVSAPQPDQTASAQPDPFISLLDNNFGVIKPETRPIRGFTENCSATFRSSGNPCVDFFFQVVPDTPSDKVVGLLNSAWQHDPLTALKLLCHLRGVRGTGKSDKERFYVGALWLHRNHPKTLALNVASFAEFGYIKDLLEILFRLLYGDDVHEEMKRERKMQPVKTKMVKRKKAVATRVRKNTISISVPQKAMLADFISAKIANVQAKKSGSQLSVSSTSTNTQSDKPLRKINLQRRKKTVSLARKALRRYTGDTKYRFLYDRIAEFFAALLSSDLEQFQSGKLKKIGLAAKWCPSLDKSFDKSTLLCEAISRIMFPRDSDPDYESLSEEYYAYRIRNRLRREVLVPLRKVLELPEVYMSAKQWKELPYHRVASVAMKRYKKLFLKHDESRFNSYLEKVKSGDAKIAAGALLPHEIAAPAYRGEDDEVAELQWRRMVDDLSEKGTLSNCIAVCDVSPSMTGMPVEVCVALGVLVSELSEKPWRGKVITFHENPQIQMVRGKTLKDKMSFVKCMAWGGSTNFQSVFDRILETAVQGRVKPDGMVKKLFVFSDMEFDEASGRYYRHNENSWETDYEVICRKFTERGYGDAIPEIVFWNLRDSNSVPVTAKEKGVALVSGFSKNLLKVFLEGKSSPDPEAVMMEAISGDEYQKLVVFD
ncbi:hypothetical protein LUZ60_003926 [Juncus effusus]|nr:hypothetical protein LUZ60_003926 [Juncus effusus]